MVKGIVIGSLVVAVIVSAYAMCKVSSFCSMYEDAFCDYSRDEQDNDVNV